MKNKIKTISIATLTMAATSLSANAGKIQTDADAIDQLTGAQQPRLYSVCVEAEPTFVSMGLSRPDGSGPISEFHGFKIKGTDRDRRHQVGDLGDCEDAVTDQECKKGFIKVTSTVPLVCSVPIGL